MVWLSPFEPEEKARPYGTGILCRRHADALVVPRGWHVDDRREAVPRLFIAPAPDQQPAAPKPIVAKPAAEASPNVRRIRGKDEPAAELFDEPAVPEIDAEPVLDETQAMPWSPKLIEEAVETTSADEPARGGLLARAFGNKDRRERH